MWAQIVIAALQAAPEIIKSVEAMFPGQGRSAEKQAAALTQQRATERLSGCETPELAAARVAKLEADIAYANALAKARS